MAEAPNKSGHPLPVEIALLTTTQQRTLTVTSKLCPETIQVHPPILTEDLTCAKMLGVIPQACEAN